MTEDSTRLEHLEKLSKRIMYGLLLYFALVVAGFFALQHANDEIQESRRYGLTRACLESNYHHQQAKGYVDQLVAKSPQKHLTREQMKQQHEQVELFLEAIAPKYDCKKRTKELTKP